MGIFNSILGKLIFSVALVEFLIMLFYENFIPFTVIAEKYPLLGPALDTLILTLVISIIYFWLLQKPLRELIVVLDAVKKKDFSRRIADKRNDELGVVARQFNDMSEELKNWSENLEQKVQERTKESSTILAKLVEQNKTLEDTKKATLNILEDLAHSKDNLEKEIAERKKKQEELLTLARVVEQSPATVVVTNTKAEIEFVNPKFTSVTGYSLEEVLGKNPRILKSGKTPPEAYTQMWEALTSGHEWHGEFCNKKKNGEFYYEAVSVSPIRNTNGETIHYVAVKEDITERKRNEQILKETHEALEKAHQSLQESSAKLIQSAKMTALGELVAGVAHELNQPLNVTKIICQGILHDIQKGRFSEEDAKKDLPEVVTQMNKMAEIITHMRLFTHRSDALVCELHDINAVVQDALKFVSQQYKDHNIELIENFSPGLPPVMIDKVRMEQVCLNFFNNARYAVENSKKQAMKVEIKTYQRADGKEVVLEITDNGMGIPDEVKTKIFQPFFTTKEPGKGTGLGLSICYQIIEEHKGRLEFDSRSGEGTTFRVILPTKV